MRRELSPNDLSDEQLGAALADVSMLALAADDDSGNVDLALRAKRIKPDLPLVVRLFDNALASYLEETLSGVRILSMSGVAAPVFAEAANQLIASASRLSTGVIRRIATSKRRRFRVDPILGYALLSLLLLVFPSALFFSHTLGLRYIDALYFV